MRTHLLLGSELDRLEACLREGCRLVFLETPTNPRMEIFDIAAIAELAHRHGARLAVDNTFASPVNQRPLELGADFVGAQRDEIPRRPQRHHGRRHHGQQGIAGADLELAQEPRPDDRAGDAALLARSLRTLVVRVERQNATAQAVAEAMARHPQVARVFHPGLPDSTATAWRSAR
jgi:cystathionine gamma-synthase